MKVDRSCCHSQSCHFSDCLLFGLILYHIQSIGLWKCIWNMLRFSFLIICVNLHVWDAPIQDTIENTTSSQWLYTPCITSKIVTSKMEEWSKSVHDRNKWEMYNRSKQRNNPHSITISNNWLSPCTLELVHFGNLLMTIVHCAKFPLFSPIYWHQKPSILIMPQVTIIIYTVLAYLVFSSEQINSYWKYCYA